MSQFELPADVRHLLTEHIRSIEQLEILLLLRDGASRCWTPAEVYQVVQSSERSVENTLASLHKQGLIVTAQGDAAYRFGPRSRQLEETVSNLAHFYSERRVRVVEAIYAERPSEVDAFAKAFRLRKDPNG